jgi:hypothetical protein
MNADCLIAALALPPEARVDQARDRGSLGIEGRIFNLDFDKGFEILDLTREGGYSICQE